VTWGLQEAAIHVGEKTAGEHDASGTDRGIAGVVFPLALLDRALLGFDGKDEREDATRMTRSFSSLRLGLDLTLSPRRLFLILLIVGFGLRIGYGVVRYRSDLFHLSGESFIASWDFDGLEHVLIAKALLSGKGYVVDSSPILQGKHIRYIGEDAVFKAPLYQFFLEGIFAISGFSFLLFFPLQALLGGLLSGFVGLITLDTFQSSRAALFAGLIAAAHPVLVNSASEPYNENLFFFLFVAAIWAFLVWLRTRAAPWAILAGALVGLSTLARESGLPLLVAMGGVGFLAAPRNLKSWVGCVLLAVTTVAVVAPWTLRNYLRFGTLVPVASILGTDLALGNNECTAWESILTPYWAEGPCLPLNERRRAFETSYTASRMPVAVKQDRISTQVALAFIREHPAAYGKLALRRLWTTLLPYDPRGNQRLHNRIAFLLYWLAIFPAGIAGMMVWPKRTEAQTILLVLLMGLNLLSIMAVLYWSDLRFRVGIDLLLGCFAGWYYSKVLGRPAEEAPSAQESQ